MIDSTESVPRLVGDLLCRKSITRLSSVGVGCPQLGPLSIGGGVRYSLSGS